jgi:hypothetical protein
MTKNNEDMVFRLDEYKCYRLALVQAGFFWGIIILVFGVDHASVTWHNWWPLLFLIAAPVPIILFRHFSYVAVENGHIVVRDVFKNTIEPSELESVSYQTRSRPSIALIIKYHKDDRNKIKVLGADWFNTDTLIRMNNAFMHLKPDLEISIDEGAQKGMEKRKDLHLKMPKSVAGWISFIVLWFAVGFVFITVLTAIAHNLG